MAARADCGRTLARSHGHFDTLLVGAEVGVLVDKASETMAAVQNRDQFMSRKRAAANLYDKPLQTPEPRDRLTLRDDTGVNQRLYSQILDHSYAFLHVERYPRTPMARRNSST